MLFEDSLMSIENSMSPIKKDPDISALSWNQQILLEEQLSKELLSSSNKIKLEKTEEYEGSTSNLLASSDDINVKEEIKAEIKRENSSDREISLDFIDSTNEEKFDRLVKEEKLKTPFKRRHSANSNLESRSNSPNFFELNTSQKRSRYDSNKFRDDSPASSSSSRNRRKKEIETDPGALVRRQKQIDYGKNTVAYDRYIRLVPKNERTLDHPKTPDVHRKYSRRAFDGLVKIWKKRLHEWEPPESEEDQ